MFLGYVYPYELWAICQVFVLVTLPPFSLHLEDFSMRAADWGTNIQLEDQWEFQNPKMRYYTIFLAICWGYIPWKLGQTYMESVPPINRFLLHGHWQDTLWVSDVSSFTEIPAVSVTGVFRPSLIQSQIVRGAAGSSAIEKLPNSYRPVTLVSAGDTTGAKRALWVYAVEYPSIFNLTPSSEDRRSGLFDRFQFQTSHPSLCRSSIAGFPFELPLSRKDKFVALFSRFIFMCWYVKAHAL